MSGENSDSGMYGIQGSRPRGRPVRSWINDIGSTGGNELYTGTITAAHRRPPSMERDGPFSIQHSALMKDQEEEEVHVLCVIDTLESSAASQSLDADDTAAAAAAAAESGSSLHPAGGDGMSTSLRELVDVMHQFKSERMTLNEAETFYYDWKTRHDGGFTRSFKQKQVGRLYLLSHREVIIAR